MWFSLASVQPGLDSRSSFKPGILGLFVYTILLTMWLKFLVIWRLFRFWALCDGVEPPENMQVRCLLSNAAEFVKHRRKCKKAQRGGPAFTPTSRSCCGGERGQE